MLLNHKTQMTFSIRRNLRSNVQRRSHLTSSRTLFVAVTVALISFFTLSDASLGVERNDPVGSQTQPKSSSYAYSPSRAEQSESVNSSVYAAGESDASARATQTAVSRKPSYSDYGEPAQNGRCLQKTFRVPTDKDAALVGTFVLSFLPKALQSQTSWRYDDKDNTLTVYGPAKSIELSEKFLNDFSEPMYEAFLNAREYVSVAGVSPRPDLRGHTNAAQALAERANGSPNYYDPARNRVVKVAYEPEGALMPERSDYAVTFGAGDEITGKESVEQEPKRQTPRKVWGQSPEIQEAATDEDSKLDVVSYRCLPSACDQVGLRFQRQFASNPSVAFTVDRDLGTIIVHTTKKTQREVERYLAQFQVYPDKNSDAASDMRIATGTVERIDGVERDETAAQRVARQTFAGNQTSNVSGPFADQARASEIDDVYQPQYRKAEELQDALLQLFGERLQRRETSPDAPYSMRQIATYRFVKRQRPNDVDFRTCDVAIDALHNQIALQGDAVLCTQMLALLRAMDQPPLRNGNVRRFIPIRNGDSYKIRQIFEYDSPQNTRKVGAFSSRYTLDRIARQFNCEGELKRLYDRTKPISDRYASYFSSIPETDDQSLLAKVSNASTTPAQALQAAFQAADTILQTNGYETSYGVRQVAYQDEGNSSLVQDGPLDPNFDRTPHGVGVVQDFTPTVLQDIDVIIVDNATEAEFERIKQMIEQIEELAKIADVKTEIYYLEHVDCAMLHGVLTTLYEEMFTTKQGRVVFYALQNPNALLVAGWGQAFKDMKDLIELFDQPIKEGTGTIRVVHLNYASVDEIASLLTETFVTPQTTGTGGLAPRIRAFADVRTNSLIIQAAPNDWEEIQSLLLELDVNKATTKLTTRVFPLKNSLAENIRTTIMNAILPAKQGTLETSAAKFPVLELLSVDDSGRKLVESGIMMDVDVVADVYHNQLIVNAPEDCMEFMERLIELLDVAPKKAQIRFFQVRNGDAGQIAQTIQSILATSDNNLSTPTLPQAEGEESFVPVRFAIDSRTNVIIAAAAPKELAIVDALIVALDVKDTSNREEVVVQLRNIQALVVAQAIDDYLTQKQTLETTSEVLSNYQLYESQVIVIPESISNSIIVSASPNEMDSILEMIKTFDRDPPQVVIQVLIAEVTLSNQEEFGIEAGLQDAVSFDRSLVTTTSSGTTGKPGFDIIGGGGPGQNIDPVVSDVKDIAGQVLNNFAMGTSNSSLGYGGFVVSASSRSVALTLRALREKNRLQVLSRPQVTAMDNQQAFILVGQRVPRINGTTTTNYGVQMNTTDTPVGLILLVTPRVTQDGKVVMEIGAEKSSLGNDSDATPIYSQDGEVIKSKSIDTIQAMTAISARDGETVMLGGLMTSSKEKISRGVPYLSDVPVLGWLFRYDQEVETRKELLIVMTPRIMRTSDDYKEALRVEMNRTTVNLDEAMAIHGNMGLYDPRTNTGCEDRDTKRIWDQIIHPDKMDDLENLPGYSPERDYAPRKDAPVEQLAPYSRSSRNGATAPSSSRNAPRALQNNATSPESPANTSPLNAPSKATDPSVEDFNLNDDVILLNNDLTSKDRPKDERATRVAMRTPSNEGGTTRAANSEKREKTSQKTESARSTGSENKSAYESERKKDSDDLSDVRSTRRGSAERYDAIESASIRGQDVLQRPNAKPLSNMTENSGFRLFHWFKPELAD